jgi:hypothetical protein
MNSRTANARSVVCVLSAMAAVAALVTSLLSRPAPARAEDNKLSTEQGRAGELIKLGKKFSGANSCAGAKCHDQPNANANEKQCLFTELTTWKEQDSHARAFTVLANVPRTLAKKHPELKEIAGKLKIDDPEKSDKCLSCHALNVPANLQGDKFAIDEGVSCGSCHGPSELWLAPHQKDGWTNQQRQQFAAAAPDPEWKGQAAHDKLLATLALYDTKPLVARAEICVSCHLAIDPAMVAAGHPQPFFELNRFLEIEPKHWRERGNAGLGHVRVWAVGQVVAFREALKQVQKLSGGDAAALKDALATAIAHGTMVEHLTKSGTMKAPAANLADLGKLRDAFAGKGGDVAGAAKALEGQFKNLANPALEIQPANPMAMALAKAIGSDPSLPALGLAGAQQQAMAVWSLVTATGAAESDDLKALVEFNSQYRSDAFDPAGYAEALKKAAPK